METFLDWLDKKKPKTTFGNLQKAFYGGACGGKPCSIVGSQHVGFDYDDDNGNTGSFTRLKKITQAEVYVENNFLQKLTNNPINPVLTTEEISGFVVIKGFKDITTNSVVPLNINEFIKSKIFPELNISPSSSYSPNGPVLQQNFNNGSATIEIKVSKK